MYYFKTMPFKWQAFRNAKSEGEMFSKQLYYTFEGQNISIFFQHPKVDRRLIIQKGKM